MKFRTVHCKRAVAAKRGDDVIRFRQHLTEIQILHTLSFIHSFILLFVFTSRQASCVISLYECLTMLSTYSITDVHIASFFIWWNVSLFILVFKYNTRTYECATCVCMACGILLKLLLLFTLRE